MKLVLAWIAALVVAVAAAGSCSVNHKSSDYECTSQADCAGFPGRTCAGGFCVTGDPPTDARTDAPPSDGPRDGAIDSPSCPSECTSCNQAEHQCVIDCAIDSCNGPIVCPAGWSCTIGCSTANSCTQGIDCSAATGCTIACSGAQSCRDLSCGQGRCKVACTGRESCRDMDCSDSCGCDITCTGGTSGASCEGNICPDFQCEQFGGRCTSSVPGCNTCP